MVDKRFVKEAELTDKDMPLEWEMVETGLVKVGKDLQTRTIYLSER